MFVTDVWSVEYDDGPSSAGGRFTGGAIQRPWPGPRSSCQGNTEASSVISSSCANMTRGVACRGRDSVVWSSTISPYTWQLLGTCVLMLSTLLPPPQLPSAGWGGHSPSRHGGNKMCGGGLAQPTTCFVYFLFRSHLTEIITKYCPNLKI